MCQPVLALLYIPYHVCIHAVAEKITVHNLLKPLPQQEFRKECRDCLKKQYYINVHVPSSLGHSTFYIYVALGAS